MLVHPPGTRIRNLDLAAAVARDDRPNYIISALAHLPANVFSGFISGRLVPTPAQQERIAAVLGVPVADLFASSAEVA